MRALDLVAHAHTASAEDAAVVIHNKTLVRTIHFRLGIAVRVVYVRDLQTLRKALQFAVPVGNAHRADVVALREQQFQNVPTVAIQPLGSGDHFHALFHARYAGGQKPVGALDLDQAQSAGSDL